MDGRGATSSEVEARRPPPLLLVPLGSYEQHGPHLPLDTDTRIAEAIAGQLAGRPDVVVAPALAYGASGEHAGFAGTLSVGTGVLADQLVELVRSARGHFAGVVFASAHGGNGPALARAVSRSRAEGDPVWAWTARLAGGDGHAGRTETSLLLAIAPQTVRTELLEPGRLEPLGHLWAELREHGVKAVSPNGVLGDPRGASAVEGAALLAELVADLEEAIGRWAPVAAGAAAR